MTTLRYQNRSAVEGRQRIKISSDRKPKLYSGQAEEEMVQRLITLVATRMKCDVNILRSVAKSIAAKERKNICHLCSRAKRVKELNGLSDTELIAKATRWSQGLAEPVNKMYEQHIVCYHVLSARNLLHTIDRPFPAAGSNQSA
jgi:hypothetical protein